MLRRSYNKLMQLAGSRHAGAWLGVVAFCEGVFFPIPPDVMLAPVVLAKRERAWTYALICTVGSIAGGSTGYLIGYFLHPVGTWLLQITGNGAAIGKIEDFYGHWGVPLLALPIPYKLLAIASGLARYNFLLFVAASTVLRGSRFCLVAFLAQRYGAPVQAFIEKRLGLVVSLVALALVAAVMVLKWLL